MIRKAGEKPMSFSEAKRMFRDLRAAPPDGATSIELWSGDGGMVGRVKYGQAQAAKVTANADANEPQAGEPATEPEAPMEPSKRGRHHKR